MTAKLHAIESIRRLDHFLLKDCEVDLTVNTVRQGNTEVRLTPKAGQVLGQLARRAEQAVTRDELLDSVWKDAYPTDDVLSHAITELRRALGDQPRNSQIIETIPKVGYRLLVIPEPVSRKPETDETARTPKRRGFLFTAATFLLGTVLGALTVFLLRSEPPPVVLAAGDPLLGAFPVTANPGPEGMPAISADGTRVAYLASDNWGEPFDVFVKPLTGDVAIQLTATPEAEFSPAWSPDSERVAFLRFSDAGCQVVIAPVSGGLERVVGSCPHEAITYLDWSPDGRYLAMVDIVEEQETLRLVRLELATGEVHPMEYDYSATEHDVQPKYSPDGQWLVFRRGANPRSELHLIPAEGGIGRPLTAMGSRIYGFDWVAGGRRIWFCAERDGQPALWQVGLEGAIPTPVSDRCTIGLSAASASNTLVFEDVSSEDDVMLLGNDGAEASVFVSTRSERDASFSPSGEQVIFVSDRSGEDQIWLGELATGQAFQLTRLTGMSLSTPRFFPDGERILFLGRGGGQEVLFVVNSRSGVVEQLSEPDERIRSAFPSSDGESVFVASNRDGDWQIWRRSQDGDYSRLTSDGGHRPFDSGDGYVYYTKVNIYGLWRTPVDGDGPEEFVSPAVSYAYHERWLIRDGQLIIPRYTEHKPWRLVAVDLSTEEETVLLTLPSERELMLTDVSAAMDRFLLFEARDRRRDVLAVRNFSHDRRAGPPEQGNPSI